MKKFIVVIFALAFVAIGCSNKKSITLKEETINIEISESYHLPIELHNLTLKDLIFTLNDPNIVTLESDVLIPLNLGTTTLTIAYQGQTSVLTINVIPELPKLRYSGDYLELSQKSRIDVINFDDNNDFNWEIADESIISLSIENKVYYITALKIGKTQVTVTAKDNPLLSKTVTIEVRENTPILDAPLQLLAVGAKTQMQITNLNNKTLDDYTWEISDTSVVSLDENYVLTALKAGKATITVTSNTNNLVKNTFEITVGIPSTKTAANGEPTEGPLYLTPGNLEATVQAGEVIDVSIFLAKDKYKYRWRALDPTIVAATDKGKIIGIKAGRTTVVVESKANPTLRGEIDITVVGTPNVDYADRIVQIALAEESYEEGYENYNKYGDWFMYNNVAWCAIFVSWCANQAGIGIDVIPKAAAVSDDVRIFQSKDQYRARGEYQPKKGDLIFFQEDGLPTHVGIVTGSDESYVYTIEGNTSNGVHQRTYALTDTYILGYGLPAYPPYTK